MPYRIIAEQCNGCGLCARFCPVDAIKGERKSEYVINIRRCINCGVCGRACSKSAITDGNGIPAAKKPRKEWPIPIIDSNRCSACSMCIAVCRFHALGISHPYSFGQTRASAELTDVKVCVGCGLCVRECLLECIQMGVIA